MDWYHTENENIYAINPKDSPEALGKAVTTLNVYVDREHQVCTSINHHEEPEKSKFINYIEFFDGDMYPSYDDLLDDCKEIYYVHAQGYDLLKHVMFYSGDKRDLIAFEEKTNEKSKNRYIENDSSPRNVITSDPLL